MKALWSVQISLKACLLFGASFALVALMVSCSGSVLTDRPSLPAPLHQGLPTTPLSGNAGSRDLETFTMDFLLNGDEEVFEESLAILFAGQDIDAFDVSNFEHVSTSLRVRATDVYPQKFVTQALADLTFKNETTALIQEWFLTKSFMEITQPQVLDKESKLKSRPYDVIEAEFQSHGGKRRDVIVLKLKRIASSTAEARMRNKWNGAVWVKKDEKEYKLGSLSGFLEYLPTKTKDR